MSIPGVPPKAERSIFLTLIFENIALFFFFSSSDRTLSSKKNDTQDHWNWLISFHSMVISQNIVIVNFLFIFVTFQSGIMAFLTSLYIVARKPIDPCKQNKRENLWTAILAVNSSRRFNKILKWLWLKKWLYNQYYRTKSNDLGIILFRRQCFIWWNQNMLYIFEYQSNENRGFRFFLGHPVYLA